MKKIVSLLLSVVMLISALSVSLNAYAAGFTPSKAQRVELNTQYSRVISASDPSWYGQSNYRYHLFVFDIPISGTLEIYIESDNGDLVGRNINESLELYDAEDIDNYVWRKNFANNQSYNTNKNMYYNSAEISLTPGTLFLAKPYSIYTADSGSYNIVFRFFPNVTKPSSFKVSSRKTTSIGLTWGRVGDVDGYQLYRNTKSGWKWVTNTTANSYTVYDLKPGVKYDFRVRSYVEADGKKYYSGWKNLATPTKPATVTIKTPTTNKKHQIIAKWKKVADGTGYNVQYSKSKSFSSVIASKHISGISKTSYTGKNFTKGKTYYVRVRAYKTVNGTKYYGSWSKVKSIKSK